VDRVSGIWPGTLVYCFGFEARKEYTISVTRDFLLVLLILFADFFCILKFSCGFLCTFF